MSDNLVPIEITGEFYDAVKQRRRGPEEGVVEETADRAKSIVAIGAARYVQEGKRQAGSPENKSLSGPPENKATRNEVNEARAEAKRKVEEEATETVEEVQDDGLDDLTVAELNNLAEERGIELPDGYVKKVELINIIRSES